MKIEKHELDLLAADLEKARHEVPKQAGKVTGMACNHIKKDVGRRWRGMPHLKRLPYVTTYDVWITSTKVIGEVGADHKRKQGKLAWVAEYGTPTSAPHPAFAPATDKETPAWLRYLDEAAAKATGLER